MNVFSEWVVEAYCFGRWDYLVLSTIAQWWQQLGWEKGGEVLQTSRVRQELLEIWQNKNQHQNSRWGAKLSECLDWSADYYRSAKKSGLASPSVATFLDPTYPTMLLELEEPPSALWASKPWSELSGWFGESQSRLAVIGSRRWSSYGQQATTTFVRSLVSDHHFLIVSGCAFGIDSLAHQKALDYGGKTVGVLGCGIDQVTARTKKQFDHPNALLLSEFPPTMPAEKWTFPQRNRLISGLSLGVLIIEAQQRSGTLITASTALAQGKELFVVTQPFTSPNAAGVIRLVNQGSHLVAQPSDVIQIFFPQVWESSVGSSSQPNWLGVTALEQRILQAIWEHGGRLSEGQCRNLIAPSGSDIWTASLLNLELRGIIHASLGVLSLL